MLLILIISFIVMMIIYFIFYLLSFKNESNPQKISAYECGFDGGSSSRMMFSYRFFLISILFLVFDVEIVLLIPFTYYVGGVPELIFIMILMVGLAYEFMYGSLEWL